MNLLAYVHLRNIYRSTGAGRVAREMTEHLAQQSNVRLQILADPEDHKRIVGRVGAPWTNFHYCFTQRETSRQQALWYLTNQPTAETYWPDAEIVYCTAESYVPVKKARLAVTCHDMQLFEAGAHALSRRLLQQRLKWWLLFKRLSKTVDMFHTISNYSAERMTHYFPGIGSRIRVVPNAVSERFFQPPSIEGLQTLTDLGLLGKPYLLVPGGLHHRKNAEIILAAWPQILERYPELMLVITSHNSPEYIAQAHALGSSVILAGFQEEEQLVALYANSHLVWFPSRYEGFGMPVLEAMACGASVVTSNTSALPEVAGGAAAALLDPDRPNDHIEAILALLNDDGARERAGELGRVRAANFTWARSTEMLTSEFALLL